MKIGLCGAGGTGKGTLGNSLLFNLMEEIPQDFCFIESPIQRVVSTIFPNCSDYKDLSYEQHKIAQYSCLFAQQGLEESCMSFPVNTISERSIFDIMAYTKRFFTEDDYADFEKTAKAFLDNGNFYEIIFYLPIEFDPKDKKENSWKERNSQDRFLTDRIMRELLAKHQPADRICELTGSLEKRLDRAVEFVKERRAIRKRRCALPNP